MKENKSNHTPTIWDLTKIITLIDEYPSDLNSKTNLRIALGISLRRLENALSWLVSNKILYKDKSAFKLKKKKLSKTDHYILNPDWLEIRRHNGFT